MDKIFALVIRHVLTALAGGLIVKYGIDGQSADAIMGGTSALAGVVWSIYEKKDKI